MTLNNLQKMELFMHEWKHLLSNKSCKRKCMYVTMFQNEQKLTVTNPIFRFLPKVIQNSVFFENSTVFVSNDLETVGFKKFQCCFSEKTANSMMLSNFDYDRKCTGNQRIFAKFNFKTKSRFQNYSAD